VACVLRVPLARRPAARAWFTRRVSPEVLDGAAAAGFAARAGQPPPPAANGNGGAGI